MMTRKIVAAAAIIVFGVSILHVRAAEVPSANTDVTKKSTLVCDVYPGLASNSLTYARLSDLPSGVILKTDSLTVKDTDIAGEIAKVPPEMQAQVEKNAGFFMLENLAARQLLLSLAKPQNVEQKDAPAPDEQEMIQKYLKGLIANVEVSDAEVAKFYEENKDACGGATLDQVKDQIKQLVLQQKQQDLIDEHVRTLGRRTTIEISASWAKEQSLLAKDNPVDKARSSGKPSLVDFGSTGCRPCDMLAPILETLKKKYAGKLNVLFIHVGQEQILAARYGIQSIPMQFFYDKEGKEVFRHLGFWPQVEIEKKLAEMGVTQ
ncbi:MAG TPA: thioredoxin family protein [Sedimentisphaerales bacterium]|nr:thioredoxin family protein [Sedimentisphaerales bacterium]